MRAETLEFDALKNHGYTPKKEEIIRLPSASPRCPSTAVGQRLQPSTV